MPDTQWVERTRLARERSMLAFVLIGALLMAHGRDPFGFASGLMVTAIGLSARAPRHMAFAALVAAVCAAISVVLA